MAKRKGKAEAEKGREFDLHVWITPETEDMQALVTMSGNGACYDLTIDHAARWFQDLLEQEAELVKTTTTCDECGAEVATVIGCPDGAEICQECFDGGKH